MAEGEYPRTPKQGTLLPENDADSLPESDSLRSSLESQASSIFSLNESVSSNNTKSDWLPTPGTEGDNLKELPTLPVPSIRVEDTEPVDWSLKEELDASTDVSARKSMSITCLRPESNRLTRSTTTVMKEEKGHIEKLNLLETYNQTFRDRHEPPTSSDPRTTRQRSFSFGVDFQFADNRIYRTTGAESRIKSDIGVKSDYIRGAMPQPEIRGEQEPAQGEGGIQGPLVKLLPVSAFDLLIQDSLSCIATAKSRDRRCRNKIRKTDITTIRSRLANLHFCPVDTVRERINECLGLVLCHVHQAVARRQFPQLLGGPSSKYQPGSLLVLTRWLGKLSGSDDPMAHLVDSQYPETGEAQVNKLSPSGRLVPPQVFQRHKAALSKEPIQTELRKYLTRPLASMDSTQTGFIYVFWYPGGFGHVKIGHAKDVEKRMNEWSKQCGRKTEKYFPCEQADLEPVPHRLRVEQLVHAELARYRREEPRCEKCGGRHVEWFEVDVSFAISVVRKWVNWMRGRPYEPVELENGGIRWVLHKRHMDNIVQLSTPSLAPTSTSTPMPTRKPKPKRSSTRRKSVR
ncbi:GIY-YIG nuclease family protein [Aspergillus lucknowensis]|uniref:Meiotically up-regulated gene 113-domain-containing protein n=1 Tax=Aspergillus lucknowensis TaxID=176173 RepID=A0ABR4LLG3_9EURO